MAFSKQVQFFCFNIWLFCIQIHEDTFKDTSSNIHRDIFTFHLSRICWLDEPPQSLLTNHKECDQSEINLIDQTQSITSQYSFMNYFLLLFYLTSLKIYLPWTLNHLTYLLRLQFIFWTISYYFVMSESW